MDLVSETMSSWTRCGRCPHTPVCGALPGDLMTGIPGPRSFVRPDAQSSAGRQPAVRQGNALDATAIVLSVCLIALIFADRYGPLRVLLTLGFAFFVPGRAIVGNWPRMGRWSEAAMSMVFSIAVLIILTTVMLWIHAWHPLGLFLVVAALSLVALIVSMARRYLRTRGPEQ
jgi:hypothetical protein